MCERKDEGEGEDKGDKGDVYMSVGGESDGGDEREDESEDDGDNKSERECSVYAAIITVPLGASESSYKGEGESWVSVGTRVRVRIRVIRAMCI